MFDLLLSLLCVYSSPVYFYSLEMNNNDILYILYTDIYWYSFVLNMNTKKRPAIPRPAHRRRSLVCWYSRPWRSAGRSRCSVPGQPASRQRGGASHPGCTRGCPRRRNNDICRKEIFSIQYNIQRIERNSFILEGNSPVHTKNSPMGRRFGV